LKEYSPDKIRNFGLVSHGGVGKTSLAEAMLFSAGITTRLGKVEDGTTVSDYNADEIDRKISISSSLMNCDWKNHKVNIIDMPGYTDFIGEVKGSLRVTDLAVILLNGQSGVEVGTEMDYRVIQDYKLPRIMFINRLDKEHANFDKVVEQVQKHFGTSVVLAQFPVNQGESFDSIVDLVTMKLYTFAKDTTGKYTESEIPANLKSKAEELRNILVEKVAENNDDLLNIFFDTGTLSAEQFSIGLKEQIANSKLIPILCGSATNNIGVQTLLNFIVEFGPSPLNRGKIEGMKPGTAEVLSREPKADAPLAAFVFKTVSEPHVGELSFIRIFSGTMKPGMEVVNPNKSTTEKIGQIYFMNGKDRKEIGIVSVGDICALVKLRNTHTSNTLCEKNHTIQLPDIAFPDPVIHVAVQPKAKGDEEKISTGLSALHESDPTFNIAIDSEIKQIIVSGQGELHLDIIMKRLKEKFGVEVDLVEPKIPYRETIKSKAEGQYKHKKQSGGRGQYGDVHLRLEPRARGEGFEFEDAIVGGVIPGKYVPAVEKGIREAMVEGPVAGCQVVDLKTSLFFGSYHSVDSSDMAFKIAGIMCFRKLFLEAKPILLEPIYDVEIEVPDDYMGDVMGDISGRRGKIQGMDSQGSFQLIRAKVPLAELFKYSTILRSMTQGRGIHRRKFSHYEEVPKEIADKIAENYKAEKEH
jgi:elongation factor G